MLLLLWGLLWHPGLDGAPEVTKCGQGGSDESLSGVAVRVFKGKGDGGDLAIFECAGIMNPVWGLSDGEVCIAGVVHDKLFMDGTGAVMRGIRAFACVNMG